MKIKPLLSLLLFVCVLSASTVVFGQSQWLVAPATIPGWNPANTADILRYQFKKTGPLTSMSAIPWTATNDPNYAAFSANGELFVSNRHGNVLNGVGSISRFTFDAKGNFTSKPAVQGNSLEAPVGLAFVPTGELFAANFRNGLISRFLFAAGGNAIANGTIFTGEFLNIGLAFSPSGELFSTHDSSIIRRWTFDNSGNAISNGTIIVPGATRLHGIAVDSDGELFVADLGTDRVFRFVLSSNGTATPNGQINITGGPNGVAFSPEGELFVTSHFTGTISRFLFNASGTAVSNGTVPTSGTLGGIAISPQQPSRPRGK